MSDANTVVSAERVVRADRARIFGLIADPAAQPSWDGNDNLAEAAPGQRVRGSGEIFLMTNTNGKVRENHVVEFEEGWLIAWCPASPGEEPAGHLWRWELEEASEGTLVRHVYDWSRLHDPRRMDRARATTAESLLASIDRLAALAES